MENLIKDNCPKCGYEIDTHSGKNAEDVPKQDDISVCLKCGTFNKFDQNLKLVEFTEEDLENTDSELRAEMERISNKIKANRN